MTILTLNMLGNIAAAGAMDIGLLEPSAARLWMMIADLSAGALLVVRPGMARVIAMGYVVSVVAFFSGDPSFVLIYLTATFQLGVVAIGSVGGGGRRSRVRPDHGASNLALPDGNLALVPGTGKGSVALVSRVAE